MNDLTKLITKPTLVIDLERAENNIERMLEKAEMSGIVLRPHFKTHQSSEVGEYFSRRGVNTITVSSVDMAEYFAGQGWRDITIAFAVNPRQIEQINELASRIQLGILFPSLESFLRIEKKLTQKVNGWIKIDAGYHRSGLDWKALTNITELAGIISESKTAVLKGILTHAGYTYKAESVEEIKSIYAQTVSRMSSVKKHLLDQGISVQISVGDTPGCSVVDDFDQVDEIRPGNFVFFDLMQENLGVCEEKDIAVALACPVVDIAADREEITVYGGAVHLSKESLAESNGQNHFGRIALPKSNGWTASLRDCWLRTITQEHGIITASQELLSSVDIGDLVYILPVHSCLTANLMGSYLSTKGQTISMARYQ